MVVIPALDEERTLGAVLDAVASASRAPRGYALRELVVADNGSRDRTAEVARERGARVVREPRPGYGSACLAALAALERDPPDLVAFLDADGSDDPAELPALLAPLLRGGADLVIGSRALGGAEAGSLTWVQRFGNALAAFLLRALFAGRVTDLGPFRAVRWEALRGLGMRDRDFGWTVEMQARALAQGLVVVEVPVRYRRRAGGRSKISGTVGGSIRAGWKILLTIGRVRLGG